MTTTTHQAGDVALVTALNRSVPYRAFFDGQTWREYGDAVFCVVTPTSIRPLVLLDPEASPEPLTSVGAATLLDAAAEIVEKKVKRPTREVALLRWLANQIEEQEQPPRMPEPTAPLAQVEASTVGRPRRRFVRGYARAGGYRWVDGVHGWDWAELVDPELAP